MHLYLYLFPLWIDLLILIDWLLLIFIFDSQIGDLNQSGLIDPIWGRTIMIWNTLEFQRDNSHLTYLFKRNLSKKRDTCLANTVLWGKTSNFKYKFFVKKLIIIQWKLWFCPVTDRLRFWANITHRDNSDDSPPGPLLLLSLFYL